jgi:hypothetical protein
LTTEGVIEELRRHRKDKLALVGLVGSMDPVSEVAALARLRDVIARLETHLTEARSANRGRLGDSDRLASDILALASDIEPWLASFVEKHRDKV